MLVMAVNNENQRDHHHSEDLCEREVDEVEL
jgi:hypothetical protein